MRLHHITCNQYAAVDGYVYEASLASKPIKTLDCLNIKSRLLTRLTLLSNRSIDFRLKHCCRYLQFQPISNYNINLSIYVVFLTDGLGLD